MRSVVRTLPARLTRHRQAVLQAVRAEPTHPTAATVYDAVRDHDPGIAFATVYNALHYLVSVGLIAEVRRPNGAVSYDRETRPHDHVICRRCGTIADVHRTPTLLPGPSAYAEVAAQTHFAVERHQVEFVGLCPDCQSRAS
jgi:Fur family peroxide stress response transcriptional regulator